MKMCSNSSLGSSNIRLSEFLCCPSGSGLASLSGSLQSDGPFLLTPPDFGLVEPFKRKPFSKAFSIFVCTQDSRLVKLYVDWITSTLESGDTTNHRHLPWSTVPNRIRFLLRIFRLTYRFREGESDGVRADSSHTTLALALVIRIYGNASALLGPIGPLVVALSVCMYVCM